MGCSTRVNLARLILLRTVSLSEAQQGGRIEAVVSYVFHVVLTSHCLDQALVDSRCEVKDESAETIGMSAVGVLGLVEGFDKVGFDRWVA